MACSKHAVVQLQAQNISWHDFMYMLTATASRCQETEAQPLRDDNQFSGHLNTSATDCNIKHHHITPFLVVTRALDGNRTEWHAH